MWGVVRSSGEGGGGQVQGKVWGQVQREGAGGCSTGGPRARHPSQPELRLSPLAPLPPIPVMIGPHKGCCRPQNDLIGPLGPSVRT